MFAKEAELVVINDKNHYNLMSGGMGGRRMSKKTKEKISKARVGFSHSDETKHKMSVSKTGHDVSDETRIKISDAQKGIPKSDSTRIKMKITANDLLKRIDVLERLAGITKG